VTAEAVLRVEHLVTEFRHPGGHLQAVRDVSFELHAGERMAIVGESGCGKSSLALSLLGLIEPPGRIAGGEVWIDGRPTVGASERMMNRVRGKEMALIFQDPMSALDPVKTIGAQLVEAIRQHQPRLTRFELRRRAVRLLRDVEIPDAEERLHDYPHEYSGGMRQRVMIGIALANHPKVLIADEPTTALDVTTQAQVITLLNRLVTERGTAVILITHNLGLVAGFTDRVHVMYAGRLVEGAPTNLLFDRPAHPYTRALLESAPRPDRILRGPLTAIPGAPPNLAELPGGCSFEPRCPLGHGRPECMERRPEPVVTGPLAWAECHFAGEAAAPRAVPTAAEEAGDRRPQAPAPLLEIDSLLVTYGRRRSWFGSGHLTRAVDGVSFEVRRGETFGLVGESGCGKTTVARAIVGLVPAAGGRIVFDGIEVTSLPRPALRRLRRRMQIVFQDPYSSLDPRMAVREIVEEPLRIHGVPLAERQHRVDEMLELVGLRPAHGGRKPHEFSGGQRQRIAIARALVLGPELVILDEPVSALDVSIQAQVLNLLKDLQRQVNVTYLFIVHDLAVAEHFCDRLVVLYSGSVMEMGAREAIFRARLHPYTAALLSAVPIPDPAAERRRERVLLPGDLGEVRAAATGCKFRTRCPVGHDVQLCADTVPPLDSAGPGHLVACHFPGSLGREREPARTAASPSS
jgi:peptide/nickel transport system ATP-binding protein